MPKPSTSNRSRSRNPRRNNSRGGAAARSVSQKSKDAAKNGPGVSATSTAENLAAFYSAAADAANSLQLYQAAEKNITHIKAEQIRHRFFHEFPPFAYSGWVYWKYPYPRKADSPLPATGPKYHRETYNKMGIDPNFTQTSAEKLTFQRTESFRKINEAHRQRGEHEVTQEEYIQRHQMVPFETDLYAHAVVGAFDSSTPVEFPPGYESKRHPLTEVLEWYDAVLEGASNDVLERVFEMLQEDPHQCMSRALVKKRLDPTIILQFGTLGFFDSLPTRPLVPPRQDPPEWQERLSMVRNWAEAPQSYGFPPVYDFEYEVNRWRIPTEAQIERARANGERRAKLVRQKLNASVAKRFEALQALNGSLSTPVDRSPPTKDSASSNAQAPFSDS